MMMVEAPMAQRQEAAGAFMVRPRTAATFMTYPRHQPLVLGVLNPVSQPSETKVTALRIRVR